ncbi:hypothetical protein ACNRDG_09255 [Ralstonia pseudosolanacearum]|uniref:hypothetical protein n=1 Tax=Ralstonia pseudosolanacearum TaxID=1310165 RepID=UPI003AAE2E67
MTTNANQSAAHDTFDAELTARELDALQPNAQQLKRTRFVELFPHIKAAKERGVPVKQILAMLTAHGLKLSAATFAKLYEDASREPAAVPLAE